MATPPRDFSEFLKSLEDEGVEYLLIGGYAVGYYGYPRATADMDVWVGRQPDNASRCVRALRRFGMDSPDLVPELFLAEDRIVRMGVPPLRIEVHTGISGVEFGECYPRRHRVELGGIEVNVIALEDLRRNKRAAGRHRDLDDLEHLPGHEGPGSRNLSE